jgi:hypothetical protein
LESQIEEVQPINGTTTPTSVEQPAQPLAEPTAVNTTTGTSLDMPLNTGPTATRTLALKPTAKQASRFDRSRKPNQPLPPQFTGRSSPRLPLPLPSRSGPTNRTRLSSTPQQARKGLAQLGVVTVAQAQERAVGMPPRVSSRPRCVAYV